MAYIRIKTMDGTEYLGNPENAYESLVHFERDDEGGFEIRPPILEAKLKGFGSMRRFNDYLNDEYGDFISSEKKGAFYEYPASAVIEHLHPELYRSLYDEWIEDYEKPERKTAIQEEEQHEGESDDFWDSVLDAIKLPFFTRK